MRREDFLAKVGMSVMTAGLPPRPQVPDRLPALPYEDLISLFRERARDVAAIVHGPVSRPGVPKAVSGIAAGHESKRFLAWDDLPVAGVTSELESAGVERVEHLVPDVGRRDHQVGYETVDLGVTGADAGLAESGSVVLSHGEGRSRMASLIPDVHIALLNVHALERTISEFAHKRPQWPADSANLVVITGPSRTGDIELHLNLGVHGPRHLHVVLYQ